MESAEGLENDRQLNLLQPYSDSPLRTRAPLERSLKADSVAEQTGVSDHDAIVYAEPARICERLPEAQKVVSARPFQECLRETGSSTVLLTSHR